MTTKIAAIAAAGVLLAPAVAVAQGNNNGPARHAAQAQCNQERAQIGRPAFQQKYGKPHAYKNCVQAHLAADQAAAQQCKAERKAMGQKAFRQKYGKQGAMMHCIRSRTG
jgi:hypothetical protein